MSLNCITCGAALNVTVEDAGRRIACPNCQAPTIIPSDSVTPGDEYTLAKELSPADASTARPEKPTMATIAERQSAFARATDDSYRLAREPWYVNNCPNCHKEMNPSAVLCVKCGYHRGLGKRMKTEEIEATEPIVSRESVFTDDDPTILGLPMMPVLCSSGIALVMAALLYWVAPVALLVICVLGGLLVIGAGWFWLLYLAFSEDLVQGLLVWLVPFYFFYYVYSRWHEVRLAAVLYFIGIALIIAPFMLGIRIGTS